MTSYKKYKEDVDIDSNKTCNFQAEFGAEDRIICEKSGNDYQCCFCYKQRSFYLNGYCKENPILKLEKQKHKILVKSLFTKTMRRLCDKFLKKNVWFCIISYQYLFIFLLLFHLPVNVFAMQPSYQWLVRNNVSFSQKSWAKDVKNCTLSLSHNSNMIFCDPNKLCQNRTIILRNKLSLSTELDYFLSPSTPMATSLPFDNFTKLKTYGRICNDQCNTLPLNTPLFCDHLPLAVLLNSGEVLQSCSSRWTKVLHNDAEAEQNFIDFKTIMDHYATFQHYTVQANKFDCLEDKHASEYKLHTWSHIRDMNVLVAEVVRQILNDLVFVQVFGTTYSTWSSYKLWICSVYHTVHSFNITSCAWTREKPCPSLCSHVQASCPFFRIGNKSKVLGSQPVFLCQGLSELDTRLQQDNCYSVDCYYDGTIESEPSNFTALHPTNFSPLLEGAFYTSLLFLPLFSLAFSSFVY